MDVVDYACEGQHDDGAHDNERNVNPAHGDDLSVGCGQDSSRASWRVHSVRRSHDGRRYSTSDCTRDPLQILPVGVEMKQLMDDDSCQGREGLS